MKQAVSQSLDHTDLLRYIIAEGKIAIKRRHALLLKHSETMLGKMHQNAPKVDLIIHQLRNAINSYKSVLAAIDSINPSDYVVSGSSLYSALASNSQAVEQPGMEIFNPDLIPVQPDPKTLSRAAKPISDPVEPEPQPSTLNIVNPDADQQRKSDRIPPGYKRCQDCGQVVHKQVFAQHLESDHVTGVRKKL